MKICKACHFYTALGSMKRYQNQVVDERCVSRTQLQKPLKHSAGIPQLDFISVALSKNR